MTALAIAAPEAAAPPPVADIDDVEAKIRAMIGDVENVADENDAGDDAATVELAAFKTEADTKPAPLVTDEQMAVIVKFMRDVTDGNADLPAIKTDPKDWPDNDVTTLMGKIEEAMQIGLDLTKTADEWREVLRAMQKAIRGDAPAPAKTKGQKKAKGEKQTKAKAEPEKAKPKLVEPFSIDASALSLPEDRTKKIPLPERFFLEVDPVTIKSAPKARHQVDPSRPEACSPVMPNLKLLEATGNPYPAAADETVVTADQYKPFVAISHLVWRELQIKGSIDTRDKAIVASVLDELGIKETYDSATCVKDTLRDLCLYGLADQYVIGRSRLFALKGFSGKLVWEE